MPSSRQINASGLPSYMRRRASLPGPVIGPLSSLSLGPVSAVATARYNFYQQIVGRPGFTPIAVSWYARAAADTATMVFGVVHLISYISRFMTLMPGDVVITGTPPGVGMGKKPPRYLKPGDTVALGIAGLGEQRQKCVAWGAAGSEART